MELANAQHDKSAPLSAPEQREILHLLAKQSLRVPLAKVPSVLLIVALAWRYTAHEVLLAWAACMTGIMLLRGWQLHNIHERFQSRPQDGLRLGVLLSALNGVGMGASVLLFPELPEVERAMHTLIMLGITTGAIATTAGHLGLFLGYAIPVMTPLVVMWSIVGGTEDSPWIGPTIGMLIAFFLLMMVSLARDVARLYRESFRIRSEQASTNVQLQQALSQAEAASHAKTRFLASASHDLRQPIHTLSLFSAALSRRALDAKSQQIAHHMEGAIDALAAQLDALLDISKLDAGIVTVKPKPTNLRNLLERLYEEHLHNARQKHLHLGISALQDVTLNLDPVLLDRILRNLIGNAIKYTDQGGVDIEMQSDANTVCISVVDSGRGIPEQEQKRIFEEFYQLDNPERDRSKGLGLGLAIVSRLAQLLNIEMALSSTPGQGTRFTLSLARQEHTAETAATPEQEFSVPWQALTVLVVDDDASVRLAMGALLQELGCTVLSADNAESALAVSANQQPDLILSDVRLKGTEDGVDVVHAVRQRFPDLPALLVSGETAPDVLSKLERTYLNLIHKPVNLASLRQAIGELLSPEKSTT
ncbi:hybrid sensor histidine kinase/response regulator [Simiduia aestuariiviva]|uniref:histidine kinase n=1 Tax=Simiduia aestuariiviva TaxID=1510459 RepID=A0A839UL55_9GAMM|nr:hybrid sensor histidine kinase/response regulator [Simiduia aestuariiviva]MBB3167309.1 signal transduction histidine kinase/ActR/RegA family two-component response regulator [Simiduia aestuariiviva]